MKKIFLAAFLISAAAIAGAQECDVKLGSLKGSYEGDCKDKKANGKGTAKGEDSYSGEFKNGYPEGFGKYTWSNGDWFEGNWKKGVREGKGTMHFASISPDSVQEGYWKKNKYLGMYEHPYVIHSRTSKMHSVRVTKLGGPANNTVLFTVETITGGATTIGGQFGKMTITDVDIMKGSYNNRIDQDNSIKMTKTTLIGVSYPFRARINIQSEMLDLELFEQGNWMVEINIQN